MPLWRYLFPQAVSDLTSLGDVTSSLYSPPPPSTPTPTSHYPRTSPLGVRTSPLGVRLQSDYAAVKARVGRVGVSTLLDMRPPPLQFGAYSYYPAELAQKQRDAVVHLQRLFRGWRQRTHEVVNALK